MKTDKFNLIAGVYLGLALALIGSMVAASLSTRTVSVRDPEPVQPIMVAGPDRPAHEEQGLCPRKTNPVRN